MATSAGLGLNCPPTSFLRTNFQICPTAWDGFPNLSEKVTGARGLELARHANFRRVGAVLPAHDSFTDKFSNLSHGVGRVSQPVRENNRLSVIGVESAWQLLPGWG
jgi:hypothetical protein